MITWIKEKLFGPKDEPRWLAIAREYIGQKEILGKEDNPFIKRCFDFTGYPKEGLHDEVPWCAAFVCRCLAEAGYMSTNSAAAASFLKYGQSSILRPGAIIVFKWPSGGHHVTFFVSEDRDGVKCLGGNQANSVNISSFGKKYIESVRFPS